MFRYYVLLRKDIHPIYKQPESHPVSGLPNGLDILPDGWVNLPSIDPYEILDNGEILDEYGNGFPDETVADEAVKKGGLFKIGRASCRERV